jgi:DnaJ-class molecular chaperone
MLRRKMLDDPYDTLGVAREATAADIRLAYRKLAKAHHPDLNPGNAKAEERFKAVAAANEILSDPAKRRQFDAGEIDASGAPARPPGYEHYASGAPGRRYGPAAANWDQDDLQDIFGSMFEEIRRPGAARRGQDMRYKLTISFLQAVSGATSRLTLPNGRDLEVKIPAGTESGQVLRLRGQGGAGDGGDGDALIEIEVAPHPYFERSGQDIRLVLPVTLVEAVLGAEVEVPAPGGRLRLRIPAGSDSGSQLRLRAKGVPAHGGMPAGDLYATLRIELGQPDQALEDFLRGWQPAQKFDPRQNMEVRG